MKNEESEKRAEDRFEFIEEDSLRVGNKRDG